jgi:hypothetical protein
MSTAHGTPGSSQPVERFHATSGRLVGTASLAVIIALVAYLALSEHNVGGLRLGAGLVLFGVLVWVTQLRPHAVVYAETLLLRNSVRDVRVPLTAIDGVTVGRMLSIWTEDGRFDCVGIGKPLRKMTKNKKRGPSALLGWDRLEAYTEESTPPLPDQTAMEYPDFVESRLVALVQDARRRERRDDDAPDPRPEQIWAWPEIAALSVTGLVFAISLLL